jgi:hypothetical protein
VAVVFIGLSCLQLVPDVFGAGVHPLAAGPAGSPEQVCARGIQKLSGALDRARSAAGGPGFEGALQPEWADAPQIQASCEKSSAGLDAWAALLRLRSAEQQLARSGDSLALLDPLRREVASHLPADLR